MQMEWVDAGEGNMKQQQQDLHNTGKHRNRK
jgi:hypothetical protein